MIEVNKSSQQLIKEANMRMVFRLLHKYKTMSRADIKKVTSLSPTTVSSLVEELIENGYVTECGIKCTKTSGRKAVMLKVNPEGGFFLGLDVQKKKIKADLYCLDFSMEKSIELQVAKGENLAILIMRAISRIAQKRKILGITIGVPGVVDPQTNTLISSTVLPVEDSKYIYQLLSEAMPKVQIFLKNNSGLIALAEKEFGAHKTANSLISIDINDGVGAGVLIDGAIYDGRGMAGEFGHMSVDYKGKRCSCGSYGCLELYASVPAILEQTGERSLMDIRKRLETEENVEFLKKPAKALAFGINNIVNLLDPEVIILGGSVRILGDYFLNMVKRYYEEIAFIKAKPIDFSEIKGNPVTLGGISYSFDMLFGN